MQKSAAPLLAELAKEWNRIEGRAKEIEGFRGEAIMASINEMRYAGRRVVDFLVASQQGGLEETQVIEHLVVARTYLVNADHDLTDAVIFFVHQRFAAIQKRHGRAKIYQCCPNYKVLYPSLLEAQKIIQGSREDRTKRSSDYARLASDYVPKLMALYQEVSDNDALLLDERDGILDRNVRIVSWVSFFASIASLAGVILSIIGIWISWPPPSSVANSPSTASTAAPLVPPKQP